MKRLWPIPLFFVFLVLGSCGGEEPIGDEIEIVDELAPIDVELIVPERAGIEEAVLFSSAVTQGDVKVVDANEVVYEIWLEGQREQSELIEADQQEGHIYSLKYTFSKAGVYHVQTHVTARGLHRMPTTKILVGDANEDKSHHEEEEVQERENGHAHQHRHADVEIEKRLEEDKLIFTVKIDGSPYSGGRVTIEMSSIVDGHVKWVDLIELEEGEYELLDIARYSGDYLAIVHIEDNHIHEHVDIKLSF